MAALNSFLWDIVGILTALIVIYAMCVFAHGMLEDYLKKILGQLELTKTPTPQEPSPEDPTVAKQDDYR